MIAVGALAVALMAAPVASACPSWSSKVKSFHGSASTHFKQTAGSGQGGVTLEHGGGLDFGKVGPVYISVGPPGKKKKVLFAFRGKRTGGTIGVEDSYFSSNGQMTGAQTASGLPKEGKVTIGFSPQSCTYDVILGISIPTMSSGQWPSPPDQGMSVLMQSPLEKIPGGVALSGSAEVPLTGVEGQGTGTDDPSKGFMEFGGFPGGTQWESTFWDVLVYDDMAAPGPAYFHWHFVAKL